MTVKTNQTNPTTNLFDQKSRIADVLGGQLEKIVQIHSPKVESLTVRWSGAQAPPGWSSANQVNLNATRLPDPRTVDGLAVWIGVAMHELGHCDYSPPMSRFPSQLRPTYNLVEDPREEALVAADLPGVVPSFRQAVAKLIVDRPEASPESVWPLVAGRLYLSDRLRKAAYAGAVASKGKAWADEVGSLVRQYMRFPDPGFTNYDEAVALLERLSDLIGENVPRLCEANGVPDPTIAGVDIDDEDDPINDEPDSESESEPQAGDESEPGEGDEDDAAEEGDEDGSGSSESDKDSDGDDADDAEDADGGGGGAEGDEKNEDAGGAGDDDSESQQGGSGAGLGSGPEINDEINDEIDDAAQEELDNVDDNLKAQAKAVLRRIRHDDQIAREENQHSTFPPSPGARLAERRLLAHLKPLLMQAEAGLERLESRGRIRPDRLEAGYRPDHVFDRWKLDQDEAVEAEIVVAADISGSMAGHMDALSEAVWVMRQVVSKTSSNLRVLLWESDVRELRSKLGRGVERLSARGGTNPLPPVELATEIFQSSKSRRKWLIVMTDGMTGGAHRTQTQKMVAQLERQGVKVTVLEFGAKADGAAFGNNRMKIKSLAAMPELIGDMLRKVYADNIVS